MRRREKLDGYVGGWAPGKAQNRKECVAVSESKHVELQLTSLIRLNPEEQPTAGETPSPSVLGEAGRSPAENEPVRRRRAS